MEFWATDHKIEDGQALEREDLAVRDIIGVWTTERASERRIL